MYSSVSYTLRANVESLVLNGTAAVNATGNGLNNVIYGNGSANTLNGGLGSDSLIGNGGADSFLFDSALNAGSNVDRILDFAADDTIVLDMSVFTALGGVGTLDASAFHLGTAAQDADDRIIYDSATGRLFFDADGAGGAAAVQFATLSAGLNLTVSDFMVI